MGLSLVRVCQWVLCNSSQEALDVCAHTCVVCYMSLHSRHVACQGACMPTPCMCSSCTGAIALSVQACQQSAQPFGGMCAHIVTCIVEPIQTHRLHLPRLEGDKVEKEKDRLLECVSSPSVLLNYTSVLVTTAAPLAPATCVASPHHTCCSANGRHAVHSRHTCVLSQFILWAISSSHRKHPVTS